MKVIIAIIIVLSFNTSFAKDDLDHIIRCEVTSCTDIKRSCTSSELKDFIFIISKNTFQLSSSINHNSDDEGKITQDSDDTILMLSEGGLVEQFQFTNVDYYSLVNGDQAEGTHFSGFWWDTLYKSYSTELVCNKIY